MTRAADLWTLEEHISHRRREIDARYDFRYSQLPLVFGLLVRAGRVREESLAGWATTSSTR